MDQEIFQCLHHQFLASARVVKMGHEMLPGSKIGCMIARFTTYPATCRPEDNMRQSLMTSIPTGSTPTSWHAASILPT